MSHTNIDNHIKGQEEEICTTEEFNSNLIKIESTEYESIIFENKLLKNLIFNNSKQPETSIFNYKKLYKKSINNSKFDLSFYLKILLAIFVIMLALAFHIVYLSVASCLYYTNGSSSCWIKSWLGMRVYASFFIDLTLYLLIGLQLFLIILILKDKINELPTKN